jgi:ABC-type nitrate/sulfonate/bicarbonate transport system permease component
MKEAAMTVSHLASGPGQRCFSVVEYVDWLPLGAENLRLSGKNCGLKGMRYVAHVLIRAAFPAILVGLKIG